MNFCTKCGKEIPDGDNKLCDDCKNTLLTDIENEEESKFKVSEKQETKKEKKTKKDTKKK